MSTSMTRRQNMALVASGLLFAGTTKASADEVKLFKIVSPKDEIVVGVESKDVGGAPELGRLAEVFKKEGKIEVWRYASKKDASGDLVQAPLSRVVLAWSDVLRIEPYSSALKVVNP